MLDATDPAMLAILWLILIGVVAVLALRTFRRDQREYRRFKRFRTTKRRQHMLRRWLLTSFGLFGGLAVLTLLASGQYSPLLLEAVQAWPWIAWIIALVAANPSLTMGILTGVTVGVVLVTALAIVSVRKAGDEMISVGDVHAILPRNRQELVLGAMLSINAGIIEELLFRLALPALIFATTGSAIAAVVASLLIFGLMHSYQGVTGILVTTVIGALFMAVYILTGSIVVAIIAHALFDLRSLVIIPMGISRVHLIDGRRNPITYSPPRPAEPRPESSRS